MKKPKYKFDSTFDGEKKLKNNFANFSENANVIYEFQSKRVVGQPYFETSCWVNPEKNEFFVYEFESFVTLGKHLSSFDQHVSKEFFPDIQSLYLWTKQDKRYSEIFTLADAYCINKAKETIENKLPEKPVKSVLKTKI
jgi:hypothetical protein